MLIVPGESTSFAVTSFSQDGTLSYQWQKDGADIPGATLATYMISNVAESDEGEYRCVVSNAAGMVPSDAASLTVCKYCKVHSKRPQVLFHSLLKFTWWALTTYCLYST